MRSRPVPAAISKPSTWNNEPALDMVADDLATLSLDDAVGQDGFQRTGLNPFALPDEAVGSV